MLVIVSWLESLKRLRRKLPLVWLLFGAVTTMSLAPAVPYFMKIRSASARTNLWDGLKRGLDFRWYSELRLGSPDFFTTLSQVEWITVFFFLLVSLLLSGGTVAALSRCEEALRLGRFAQDCADLGRVVLKLFLVTALLTGLLSRVHAWTSEAIVDQTVAWDSELGVAGLRLGNDGLFLLLLLVLILAFRYARVTAVLRSGLTLPSLWRHAIGFVMRHPFRVLGIQLTAVLLWTLFLALFSQLNAVEVGSAAGVTVWLLAGFTLGWAVAALRVALSGAELVLFERLGAETLYKKEMRTKGSPTDSIER